MIYKVFANYKITIHFMLTVQKFETNFTVILIIVFHSVPVVSQSIVNWCNSVVSCLSSMVAQCCFLFLNPSTFYPFFFCSILAG